jgi:hypothetical protein
VFSLSNRWNVAKLTSAISSSLRVNVCGGVKLSFSGTSTAGGVDADALPASPKVRPAAPKAGTAALVTRFLFEVCFTRGIVASSIPEPKNCFHPAAPSLRCEIPSRKPFKFTKLLFRI